MAQGYGQDTWCGDSIVTGRFARGPTNALLGLYRRLITERGTLRGIDDENSNEDELDYGLDLAELIGDSDPEEAVLLMPGRISAELKKDERVASVFVVAQAPAYNPDGTANLFFDVSGVLRDGEDFRFTVKVADATVSLLLGGSS